MFMSSHQITKFIRAHFRHFNAAALRNAAEGYKAHLEKDGKMLIALGGAMSTAEIGLSLAEMILQDKVHAISCTGANLEEDIFNLVAHDLYKPVPNYRSLTPKDDQDLFERKLNRVTDTCIPDVAIWERLERAFMDLWQEADRTGVRLFPYECVVKILSSGCISQHYQIDPRESWLLAALDRGIPVFVPAWEDSSLGNMYAAACIRGEIKNVGTLRSGIETMIDLAMWYSRSSAEHSMGFFQIAGGVAGDFSICVVPMLQDDLLRTDLPKWDYYCQIGDSTTSYGSYSGATPSEKISWGKLSEATPSYVIESDATIVAPLIFAYVLDW
jgi:deoxyhypusine synthase